MASVDATCKAAMARLEEKIQLPCKVEEFPDDLKRYRFIHPIAALLVRYGGSRYPDEGVRSLDGMVVQDRYVAIEVSILTRRLNGDHGSGAFLDAARRGLLGWMPPDCGRCFVVEEEFDRWNDKEMTWQHHIIFEAKTLLVEDQADDESPLLVRITAIDETAGETQEVP